MPLKSQSNPDAPEEVLSANCMRNMVRLSQGNLTGRPNVPDIPNRYTPSELLSKNLSYELDRFDSVL